jgi:hypothetical protein
LVDEVEEHGLVVLVVLQLGRQERPEPALEVRGLARADTDHRTEVPDRGPGRGQQQPLPLAQHREDLGGSHAVDHRIGMLGRSDGLERVAVVDGLGERHGAQSQPRRDGLRELV